MRFWKAKNSMEEAAKALHDYNRRNDHPGMRSNFGQFASMVAQTVIDTFDQTAFGTNPAIDMMKKAPVGQLFYYDGRIKVKTPFNTIVDGQVYVDVLQNRVLELTSVDAERHIYDLKNDLKTVTTGSFFDLIGLAFKRLIRRKYNGKEKATDSRPTVDGQHGIESSPKSAGTPN